MRADTLDHRDTGAAHLSAVDWSAHPLGPREGWPPTLCVALDLALGSSVPTALYWSDQLYLIYNAAWLRINGALHPGALGRPAREVWAGLWDVLAPQFATAMSGEGLTFYDQPLTMLRGSASTETWWSYSMTPIRVPGGHVCGVLNQGNETTRVILTERARKAEAARLREIFQQAPGAVSLLHGRDLTVELLNEAGAALLGGREVIGKPLAQAVPELAAQGLLGRIEEVFATGLAQRFAEAPVTLDGPDGQRQFVLDLVIQPIRDGDGAVTDVFVQVHDVTERARAQAALRESEERLQLALDASLGIGIWDWDIVEDRVRADVRFARLYGSDPARAARGVPLADFLSAVHPDDVDRVRESIAASVASEVPYSEEYRLLRADGAVRWVLAQGRMVRDADGRAVRCPGVIFDVTNRREAENSARAAADDLRVATEIQAFVFRLADRLRGLDSPAAVMRLTATSLGRRLGADRVGFYRVLSDELIQYGACWSSDRLAPLVGTLPTRQLGVATVAAYAAGTSVVVADVARDPATADAAMDDLAAAGIGVPLRRGGAWAATLYINQARPRRWESDEVALVEAVAEIAWDAVERATAVAGLRESESKFRAIANSIDQMVWSTRPDGFHDYYNERWYEYTGVPRGTTDGEAWNDMFHPDDRERAWGIWRHSLETGEAYRIEYRLRHRSGQYRWVLGSATPVHNDNGKITRWFGTCTDIEELVAAREVLARSRVELEAAVAERTAQLMQAEDQLRQAQKMEAVGQLTGGIAHDFNNMLAVVIGGLDLLERRVAQGRTDIGRYVDAARDGATRAAALTQRLLAFSRQSPLAARAIDLNAMVAGMTDLLARTLGDSVVVETDLAEGLWLATADPSQLENAILNLSVNARDAMPRGGRLTLVTANQSLDEPAAAGFGIGAGDYVAIAVVDTGIGMAPEVATKAFDPFFTTKSVGKGTGLGLSQVFGFVRQSGGHIALETAPDAGTTLRLLLPRDTGEVAPVAPERSSGDPLPRGRRHEIVMVVEDEDRVRAYSVEALRELGYTVVHAPDGPSALAQIDNGQAIDLLFTDVVMPEMTGRELADAARERLPGLKLLYTSGYTRDAVEREGPLAGTVLAKPFDVATLANRIRAALDG